MIERPAPYAVRMTVADERLRLRGRLTELEDERAKIVYALAVLDRIEPDASAPVLGSSTQRSSGSRALGARPGGTLERAVRIINSSGRAWRAEELVPAMRDDGWSAQVDSEVETVRSALSRAVRDGLVARLSQGVYVPRNGLPEDTAPSAANPSRSANEAEDEAGPDEDAESAAAGSAAVRRRRRTHRVLASDQAASGDDSDTPH